MVLVRVRTALQPLGNSLAMSGQRREQRACKGAYSVACTEKLCSCPINSSRARSSFVVRAVLEAHRSGFRCVVMDAHVDALGVRGPSRLGTRFLHRSDLVAPRKEACVPNCAWERARRDLPPVGCVRGALLCAVGLVAAAPVRKSHRQPHGFGDVFQVEHAFAWCSAVPGGLYRKAVGCTMGTSLLWLRSVGFLTVVGNSKLSLTQSRNIHSRLASEERLKSYPPTGSTKGPVPSISPWSIQSLRTIRKLVVGRHGSQVPAPARPSARMPSRKYCSGAAVRRWRGVYMAHRTLSSRVASLSLAVCVRILGGNRDRRCRRA